MNHITGWIIKKLGMSFENGVYAYHYYFPDAGAFRLITDLGFSNPEDYVNYINKNDLVRLKESYDYNYFVRRLKYEQMIREQFYKIGGEVVRKNPYYMTWGYSWMNNRAKGKTFLRTSISNINLNAVSFTYGDSFSALNPDNAIYNREYYAKVYNYVQIKKIVEKYGFPSQWNKKAKKGYEAYIEMQIWKDDFIYDESAVEYVGKGSQKILI